ncbi:unnamed protein product [Leptosia nina]|uniref:Uncharacterized protein n=1 Tax=Leptosia nina TaxID=320188 RepID=A0AAV1J1S7_9NEOP
MKARPKRSSSRVSQESDDSRLPSQCDSKYYPGKTTTDGTVYNPPAYVKEVDPQGETEDEPQGETEETLQGETEEIPDRRIIYPCSLWINTKPLNRHATTYELERFEKNLLIIFNQEEIIGYEPRLGTEKDVTVLIETFSMFGFEPEVHKDYTKKKLFGVLDSFNHRNFSNYGCVAIVVLTHGTVDGRLRAKDQHYTEFDIIDAFKTYDKPSLVTKPKLLIIQACRGKKSVVGVNVGNAAAIRKDEVYDFEPYTLPVESDIFVLHSSYMGNPSHRDELNGSWLIQTLCKNICKLAPTHDLEYIATEVKREVAIDRYHEEYNTATKETETNKQIPVVTTTLIRKLYLRKFGDPPISCADNADCKSEVQLNSSTPLMMEFGPCLCFLDYYIYIRKYLRLYLDVNPGDTTAQSFWDISEAFEEDFGFNAAKGKMTKAIVNHLFNHAKDFEFYKYLYFKK